MRWQPKRNMLQSPINVLTCTHVKFLYFATFFLKFFVAEIKTQTDLDFFLFQQQNYYVASEET